MSTEIQTKTDEVVKEQPKTETKTDLIELLAKSQIKTNETIAELSKKVETILSKMGDANPVAHGAVLEAKPKASDEQEIGDKVKSPNAYGLSQQASIIDNKESGSDNSELSMEETKKSKPTPIVKKADDIYVTVEPIRPTIFKKSFEGIPPTGYQIMKAAENGFNHKYTMADEAFSEVIQNLEKGKYGLGFPGESEVEW